MFESLRERLSASSASRVRAALRNPRHYRTAIERLHERHMFTARMYELRQDDVPLATVVLDRSRVAKLLARTVERGEYELEPAVRRQIHVDGKKRTVFVTRLTDLVVHGTVARLLEREIEPHLSTRLFSYRRNVSWSKPVAELAAYVRAHRNRRPDPRSRGIYVVRRDVASYTDTIPLGRDSALWPMLRRILGHPGDPEESLIRDVVRVRARDRTGYVFTLFRGVPTGLPISCVLFNLYLSPLDAELDRIPGGFYARYSDDLVFAHPDAAVARSAAERIDTSVRRLGLGLNPDKRVDLYLTAAGRPSEAWPRAKGTTSAPLLGCRVSAKGTVSLNRKKVRNILRDVSQRADRTARALSDSDRDRIGRAVCTMINRTVGPKAAVFHQRSAALLHRVVTDREQLRQVDYWIARIVLRSVLRRDDVRAFRDVPYEKIRRDWGLVSLLHTRNRWGRGRKIARAAAR